mmetsp:Transcript_10827/g.28961  ORF Transcript_10827/g.28961 Transcript_10827/m.28961 type:complete len:217 (-) Transcript_10827:2-652(-)
MPALATYSKASSAVAPLQPPEPPHSLGLGVHEVICWGERDKSVPVLMAMLLSMASAAANAQQLPQSPWSFTGVRTLLPLQSTTSGRLPSDGSESELLSSVGGACPPRLRIALLYPNFCRSSLGEWSVSSLSPAVHRAPGRLLSAECRATRCSKRALRRPYSSPPYDFPKWSRYSSNVTWAAAAGAARTRSARSLRVMAAGVCRRRRSPRKTMLYYA